MNAFVYNRLIALEDKIDMIKEEIEEAYKILQEIFLNDDPVFDDPMDI